VKGVRDSSYGVLIKPDLLRQAVVPTFILANPFLTSRARTFSSTSLHLSLPFPLRSYLKSSLAFGNPKSMCVCPALKRYPRFTGTRDLDPVRLLKKLRDRKGLFYVETQLRGTLRERFITFLLTIILFNSLLPFSRYRYILNHLILFADI